VDGPDILLVHNGRRVWVETVIATEGQGPDAIPQRPPGEAYSVPDPEIGLRLLNALQSKRSQYEQALARGTVRSDDAYVVAINAALISIAGLDLNLHRIAKVLYGFGDEYYSINIETRQVVGAGHHQRFEITKKSGADVDSAAFMSDGNRAISSVLYSRAAIHLGLPPIDIPAAMRRMGKDFVQVHNINAASQLPAGWLPRGIEYVVIDNALNRVEHEAESRFEIHDFGLKGPDPTW
jgi:hypothetical protein